MFESEKSKCFISENWSKMKKGIISLGLPPAFQRALMLRRFYDKVTFTLKPLFKTKYVEKYSLLKLLLLFFFFYWAKCVYYFGSEGISHTK